MKKQAIILCKTFCYAVYNLYWNIYFYVILKEQKVIKYILGKILYG